MDTFKLIQASFSQLCEDAIYLETESEYGPENPDPHYVEHLRNTSRLIGAAQSIEDLAKIDWIAGKAFLALDSL